MYGRPFGCHGFGDGGRRVGLFKADHKSAYRQLRLLETDRGLAYTCARDPGSGILRFFRPSTLLFGAASAVLQYNVPSRVIGALVCRILGAPCIGYFDDYVAVLPRGLGGEGLRGFKKFHEILGITVEDSKCEEGDSVTFLGVVVRPWLAGGVEVSISEDRNKLLDYIRDILLTGTMPRDHAYSLGGRLSFAQTAAFRKVGRSFFPSIYQHERGGGRTVSAGRLGTTWNGGLPSL